MSLSGIEWHQKSIFDSELRSLKCKPKNERTPEEQAVVKYFKTRLNQLETKLNSARSKNING